MEGVLAGWQRQHVAQDDRNVLLLEQLRDLVRLHAAADDDIHLDPIGECHRVLDVRRASRRRRRAGASVRPPVPGLRASSPRSCRRPPWHTRGPGRTAARARRGADRARASVPRSCVQVRRAPPPRPPPPRASPAAERREGERDPRVGPERRLLPRPAIEVHHRDLAAESAAARHDGDGRDPVGARNRESRRSPRGTPPGCGAAD